MAEIFVSYRRDEAAHVTSRLVTQLRDRFGDHRVFHDRESIPGGQDFAAVIQQELSECRVLLAVIGKQWLQELDRRQRENTTDYVCFEIAAALERDIPTIPVCVDGAGLPPAETLPNKLARLPTKQAQKLDDDRFESDVARIIELLEKEYRVLRTAKERALVSVRVLCQFIGVILLGHGTWLGMMEGTMAFGLGSVLLRQSRRAVRVWK